jgi:hypothetical protein
LAIVTAAERGDGGIPHGAVLVSLADAVLGDDEDALGALRLAAYRALGPAGLSDAVAVIGLFNAIDRVADATGIPLEPDKAAASADFRVALGLDRFAVANRV